MEDEEGALLVDGSDAPRRTTLQRARTRPEQLPPVLTGHVRRVLVDSAGVITKAGRMRRLYTGRMRGLAKLMGRRCNHPGCTVRANVAEIDHLDEWDRDDGQTELANLTLAPVTANGMIGVTASLDSRFPWLYGGDQPDEKKVLT